ncbi:hypothetical protein HHK36_030250 [Tetracentron sinense]|uniref:UBX domain-containing protein n=1 Tax=Tetracentron sinense TaxID=13715 RepID=A0A834YF71_TETSI|nr:hypothetical protein HHK36_030250 [Tetracentron sinense]
MESVLTATEKQSLVSLFLEITVGQSRNIAGQFLEATSWKLEEAIHLFYVGNEGGRLVSSFCSPPKENVIPLLDQSSGGREKDIGNENVGQDDRGEEVRPPLPVTREALYGDVMQYRALTMEYRSHEASPLVAVSNFDAEMKQPRVRESDQSAESTSDNSWEMERPGVWESDQSAESTTDNSRDNLASLYRPPFALMHHGPFEKAKVAASIQDKWLLVNLQSTKEFSSHMAYYDTNEGKKVCTHYNLDSIPVVLVIDPITGQKRHSCSGMIQPERLLEKVKLKSDLKALAADETTEEDAEMMLALAASMETTKGPISLTSTNKDEPKTDREETGSTKKPIYLPLPEEPKGEKSLLCRVGVRLPDGRRLQRNFLHSDPIQV